MPRVVSERERRAEEELSRKKGPVNFMSVGTQIEVLQLVKRGLQEEAAQTDENMRRIAGRDAKIAEKYGGPEAWRRIYEGSTEEHRRLIQKIKVNPELTPAEAKVAVTADLILAEGVEKDRQAGLDDQANRLIDKANRRRQKRLVGKQPDRSHPIVKQEIIPERRMERLLHPKPKKPAEESWRIKLTASPHWQDAIKWFKMTPAEKAAAETATADAVNTEIGPVAQALAAQAEWNELEASGKLKQMDFFGYVWPTGEK